VTRPDRQERRYVAQGYAVARISSLGTHESTGCYTGAGPETAEALKAVVDWFNGRATAYDAKRGGAPVAADWTDGTTAMIGTSAEGELANAVATTGVDGLEAIVPNAANNGQYSLFRANGTPVSITPQTTDRMAELSSWMEATNVARSDCDHWAERTVKRQDYRTGDYNDFWHDREFLARADSVDAAVLHSQGLSDPIVTPNNPVDWYETLDAADVPVKLWLHQGDHRDPDSNAWSDLLDRWLAYWLKGEDNGVMDEEPVTVEHSHEMDDEGPVDTYDTWPVPDAEPTPVGFAPDGTTVGTVTATNDGGAATTESFVDDAATAAADLVEASESANRLRYESPPLGRPLRLSGRVVPDLALSFDEPTVVSVALVAYEPDVARILTRGWVDPLNRPRYTDYDSPVAYKQSLRSSAPIDEGERVRVEFPLQAVDTVAPEGSRIGLVVYGADERFTVHPPGDSTVSLSLADSEVSLPVIGGTAALTEAFAEPPSGHTETPTPNSTPTEETARTEPTRTDGEPTDSPTGTTTEDTPGFGLGIASTVLGGVGYLLARGRGGEESPADD
jgi:X-Pro dipeptidyl-peptidase